MGFVTFLVNCNLFLCQSKPQPVVSSSSGSRLRSLPHFHLVACAQRVASVFLQTRVPTLLFLLRSSGSDLIEETSIIHASDVLLFHSPILRPQQDIHGHPYPKLAPTSSAIHQESFTHTQTMPQTIQMDRTPAFAPSYS